MNFGWRQFDVVAHLVPMRRYARSLTRHAEDAEDLVQSALLRAYDRRGSFRAGEDLRTWLLVVLHSTFVDGWRRQAAERARIQAVSEAAPSHAEPAQDHALQLGQVWRAYQGLPDEQRAAFHLVALEGLSYQQAAAVLEVPIGTVMSRLARARDMLRRLDAPAEAAGRAPRGANPPSLRVVGGSHDPDA
ncbi:sigma-70 family RNA polymerase sigma factor [Roseomonas sp. 18066]|uniref:sigma-70 family RNA polymerase sigma factor n=1 Tax=Roseomonas sp. 18066 TaxID=2681412 RepID=UPI001358C15B|nr:sigma-70 family RNA polymerase sigma factor [Roseomonas sp. 18066]